MTNPEKEKSPEKIDIAQIDRVMEALPEVQAGKDFWQNDFHEFDVYEHTAKFVKHMKEILDDEDNEIDPHLVVAGWLHDIGKPVVATPKMKDGVQAEREPGKLYHGFTNHEIEGEEMVRRMDPQIFEALGLDQEKIASLVYCHYLPMKGIKETRKTANWDDFLQQYEGLKKVLIDIETTEERTPVSKREVLLMFLADKLAQGDPDKYVTDQGELFAIRDALLSEDSEQEQQRLKDIYELQKREAEAGKQYAKKE